MREIRNLILDDIMHDLGNFLQVLQYSFELIDPKKLEGDTRFSFENMEKALKIFILKFKIHQQIQNETDNINIVPLLNYLKTQGIDIKSNINTAAKSRALVLLHLSMRLQEGDRLNLGNHTLELKASNFDFLQGTFKEISSYGLGYVYPINDKGIVAIDY